ncbi:MAG: methionine--tRNA ligase [Armatimonadetes bacterium]|nr:methionine--tRNA ligase [Armatimonadota bacterium]MBS1710390.1 methionine--tRNA ligase [Armatimonadota bacterium]MBX3108973.1 methionine--tRNA ligase [Fimbriimonadaceae bacterium]
MPKRYYVTTPIYYVNSVPHVGHALTMLACDVCKRYRQMHGEDAYFLTGTDENGLKVKEAAEAAGEDPMLFVDRISQAFRDCADSLDVSYDVFFRTTCDEHRRAVQRLFEVIRDKGYIYQDKYEGWYDVSAETFVRESELVDGKSPDGNEVRWVEEDNWFFKLSAFGDRLLEKIESEPNWLLPAGRKNEVVSFIKQGLRDICITRANPGWGIPVPGDDGKVIYVWFDALINYLAATGWPEEGWQETWPADVHWMAKEIFTRFHATLWPAMLMAADLPLPKTVIAHGWFVFGESKMSKSKGNVIAPADLTGFFAEKGGCSPHVARDVVRFSLIRSLPYEGDTNYTWEEVGRIYNADLANDLGNALNRSLSMAHKFSGGTMPDAAVEGDAREAVLRAKGLAMTAMETLRLDEFAAAGIDLIRWLNKYIDDRAPWALAKNGDPALGAVVASMLDVVANAAAILSPVIPHVSAQMFTQLGVSPVERWEAVGAGLIPPGTALNQPDPIFPRLDKTVMEELKPEDKPANPEPKPEAKPKTKGLPEPAAEVEFADLMKFEFRVGRIIEAEPVEKSEKLMKLQVKVGAEMRQILAGIKKKYGTEDLIGRQVVVVANLKPAKLMGMESQGMLLAADDESGEAILLQPDSEAPEGSRVH